MALPTTSNVYDSEDSTGTINPLPPVLKHGLAAVSVFAFMSWVSALSLFVYLTYKLLTWQLRPLFEKEVRESTPEPPSPTYSLTDANGFLIPDSYLCPPKEPGPPERPRPGFWKLLFRTKPNQFLVLIYCLLFADIQQALAFLLNVTWLAKDAVDVGTAVCWMQGWFVSIGDLASSVFITAIAIHTYLGVVKGYRLPGLVFYPIVLSLWLFVYGNALLGIIITENGAGVGGLYVRAGAWCWINAAYQTLRLTLHYLWIFISLGLTSVIYIRIYITLRHHKRHPECRCHTSQSHYPNPDPGYPETQPSPNPSVITTSTISTPQKPSREPSCSLTLASSQSSAHPTFLLYPLIYVLCTAPLAAGRIYSMAGHNVPLSYFCFAGSMIACNGWLDVLLYSTTRRSLVFYSGPAPPGADTGIETFAFMRTPAGRRFGNVVYVAGGDDAEGEGGTRNRRWWKWGVRDVGSRCEKLSIKDCGDKGASQVSLKGFGMGKGEVMGMAIQCETVTKVVVEENPDHEAS